MRILKISLATLLISALLIELLNGVPARAAPKNTAYRAALHSNQAIDSRIVADSSTAHDFISGVSTLQAVEIDGTDAHLKSLPNLLEPVLVFSAVSMQGMRLSYPLTAHLSLVITASGNATGSNVTIKTSVFNDLKTALGSFTTPADLLVLLAGGTVHHLVMKNVNLKVDQSLQARSLFLPGMRLTITRA